MKIKNKEGKEITVNLVFIINFVIYRKRRSKSLKLRSELEREYLGHHQKLKLGISIKRECNLTTKDWIKDTKYRDIDLIHFYTFTGNTFEY